MKKIMSLLALVMALMMLFVACGDAAATTGPTKGTTAGTTAESTTSGTTTAATTAKPTQPVKSIKILAIGNSFSVDAMEHLWYILYKLGYEEIILGNLYIGGCSIDTHVSNAETNAGAYQFYLNRWGSWSSTKNRTMESGITYTDWDVITLQQVSQNSGQPDTFGNLQKLINYVNSKKKNDDAKLYWHMTWAYQQDTTHSGFANYNSSQEEMYAAIVNAVKTGVLTNESFAGYLPSGTTIQNLRTSYLGDTLTRDGYHLSNGLGRYAAAMTWAKFLTGESIDNIDWVPKDFPEIAEDLAVVKEAVNNAYKAPLKVTPSTMKVDPNAKPEEILPTVVTDTSITEALTDADKAVLTEQGLDPAKYAVLKLTPTVCAYYLSTSGTGLTTTAGNSPQFWATQKFGKDQLPANSVITIAAGYQYRPEGWQKTNANNSAARPGNVSTAVVKVDAKWWTNYNYRGFNVSKLDGGNVSAADTTALRIYVPIAE